MRAPTSTNWALSVYEMLTGQTPFTGINELVLLNSRLVNDPIPPREANPELSAGLEAVLLCALEARSHAPLPHCAAPCRSPERTGVGRKTRGCCGGSQAGTQSSGLSGLAMIPASLFGLLMYVASHQ